MKSSIALLLVLLLVLTSTTIASADSGTITLASRPGVTVYGPEPTAYPGGGWGTPKAAVLAWQHSSWPVIPGAPYISTAYYSETPNLTTWRYFHDEYTLPCTAYGIQSDVHVTANADNLEYFHFNGNYIGWCGQWNVVVDYDVSPQPGRNTLDFYVGDWGSSTSPTSNPTGLAYKTTVTYSVPDVVWQPPVSLDSFDLLDGSTLPLKFKLYQGDTLLTTAQNVTLKVLDAAGYEVATWVPGEGTDYLRLNGTEFSYIGNLHTRDYTLVAASYTAVVYDGCTATPLGQIAFAVVAAEGKGGKK